MKLPTYIKEIYTIAEKDKTLGFKQLQNGTKLIGNVPHIAPEAYLHLLFEPLKENELDSMNDELGKSLPVPLETFYFINNGISIFSGSLSIHGLRKNYKRKGDDVWQPFDLIELNTYYSPTDSSDYHIFIGSYKEDKSLLYIDVKTLKVYRCSDESVKPLNEWRGFEEMLLSEIKRLSKLFDEKGKLIDGIKSTLPI